MTRQKNHLINLGNAVNNKENFIFSPSSQYDWMHCFAQVPEPLLLNDRIRIYFATRSSKDNSGNYISRTTFIDVDIENPSKIIYLHNEPILRLGKKGCFDEHGISPSSVIKVGDEIRLYYGGWARCVNIPYRISIGLAISKDNGYTFEKAGGGPVLDRSLHEPYGPNSVFVWPENNEYRMIYSSILDWYVLRDKMESKYSLFYASSNDGYNWQRNFNRIDDTTSEYDCQCVPTLIRHDGLYHLWYSLRSGLDFRVSERGGYWIKHMVSENLSDWKIPSRPINITYNKDVGWCNSMVCYPSSLVVGDELIIFFCGNKFGESGFGYKKISLKDLEQ